MREELLQLSNAMSLRICKCSNIKAKIEIIAVNILIDTVSKVTCISEELYLANEKSFSSCAKLGASAKTLRVAIGKKTTKIKTQILFKCSIGKQTGEIIFLIIFMLSKDCIFGYDTAKYLKFKIDAENEIIDYKGEIISCGPIITELNTGECDSHTVRIIEMEEDSDSFCIINMLHENQPTIFNEEKGITLVDIDEKLADICCIGNNGKRSLASLICKYKEIFNSKPGLMKNVEYELKLKKNKPFLIKPYPIPKYRNTKKWLMKKFV